MLHTKKDFIITSPIKKNNNTEETWDKIRNNIKKAGTESVGKKIGQPDYTTKHQDTLKKQEQYNIRYKATREENPHAHHIRKKYWR